MRGDEGKLITPLGCRLRCIEQVRCTGCIAWWLDVLQGSCSRLVYEALLGVWGDMSLGVVT
jgi:hypothetical protein